MESAPVYFLVLSGVGLVAAALLAVRAAKRGARFYVLSAAFVAFSLVNGAIYFQASETAIWTLGGILFVLLLADVVVRSASKQI